MADIGFERKITRTQQGEKIADAEDIELDTTNFQQALDDTVTDVQKLADAVSGVNFVPGTPGSPYKYYQRLELGSGMVQPAAGDKVLNSGSSFKFAYDIVPEINTNGGLVPDIAFHSEWYGSLRVEVTTAVTLRITSKFYHFSNLVDEFVSVRSIEDRFSSARQTPVRLRGLSGKPIEIPLGALNIPSGPSFTITREFLNTPFPFRIELEIESFDTATGETNTGTTITELELVDPAIEFSQFNETVLSDTGTEIFAGILRFNDTAGNRLPLIDGTSQSTFDTTLGSATRVRGYAYRFRDGTVATDGASYTLGFFKPNDVLIAKVDDASLSTVGDWSIIRDGTVYPVTQSEADFLDQVEEQDNLVNVIDASAGGEASFVRFWLRTAPVTQGTINNPGTGLLVSEAQEDSFRQNTDALAFILYIALPDTYETSTGAANLRVEITDINGEVIQNLPLSTAFTEATELSTAGTTYYRSSAVAHSEFIGYEANETIRVFRTTLQRHFTLVESPTVDTTQNVTDLPESRLAQAVRDKLNQIIDGHVTPAELQSLENKINTLFPLSSDVDILTDWANVYDPAHAIENVAIRAGYTSLADFRATNDRYESAGVTYAAGTGVSRYSGLGTDLHRAFGFKVTAASNQTLLWIVDGVDTIPFIDMTSGANFRVNNYVPARTADEVHRNTVNFATLSAGDATLTHTAGDVATYTVPDYPANTEDQSRTVSSDIEVLVNGSDTLAAGGIFFDIPDTDVAQPVAEVTHTFFTGYPLNRSITATFSHEVRVVGNDVLIDLRLVSAPSDVTFRINNVDVAQTYTTTAVIARVDRWQNLQDGAGDYTFTGGQELLLYFTPRPDDTGRVQIVPVAAEDSGATNQLNDNLIAIPTPVYSTVEVPDTIEFRTFLPDHFLAHSNLVDLLADRATKWVYALARLNTVTERAFSEIVDLADGTKLNGTPIRLPEVSEVHQSTNTTTAAGGVVSSVVLPLDYDDFDHVHVTHFISGTPNVWRSGFISIRLLESGNFNGADELNVATIAMKWTVGTRTLEDDASAQNIWRVELVKN